jgi:hypothetical protein
LVDEVFDRIDEIVASGTDGIGWARHGRPALALQNTNVRHRPAADRGVPDRAFGECASPNF